MSAQLRSEFLAYLNANAGLIANKLDSFRLLLGENDGQTLLADAGA